MDKCPTPGKSSSSAGDSVTTLELQLQEIASLPEIQLINSILGDSAQLHIVGGTIRELAMQNPASDLDLASVLTPEQVLQKLTDHKQIKIIPTGLGHGTLTLLIDGRPIELTTFRKPGSRAENCFSDNILTDLNGRDFTCNALAYDVNQNILRDPHNGQEHISKLQLYSVGDAQTRLIEDPLRMLRMLRFGPAMGFTIDPELLTTATALSNQLNSVSIERVRNEFEKILLADNIAASMRCLQQCNLLDQFLPEMTPSVGFEQNDFHVHDVFEHILAVMERSPKDLTLRLAALFHDIGKPASLTVDQGRRHFYDHEKYSVAICRTVMQRMRFSHALTDRVCLLVGAHMRPLMCSPKSVRRLLRDLGEAIPQWKLLKYADKTPKQSESDFALELQSFEEKVLQEDQKLYQTIRSGLAINGQDLIAHFGVQPGPELGQVLAKLEDAIIDNPAINTRTELLDLAYKLL